MALRGHPVNFRVIYPESIKEIYLKNSPYVLLLHPLLTYGFGEYGLYCQLVLGHTHWKEPQLCSCTQ